MDSELSRVLEVFGITNRISDFREPETGNVNHTYLVTVEAESGAEKRFIVQQINSYAYREPEKVMLNSVMTAEWIREKNTSLRAASFYRTGTGNYFWRSDTGDYWRVYEYIEGITFATTDNLKIIENTGTAFGRFLQLMSDFDERKLCVAMPRFHDTIWRYEQLAGAYKADICGRRAEPEVRELYDWLLSEKDRACRLTNLCEQGLLSYRVTHNDTKINNVLFDAKTGAAVAIIDLDTVMPGLVGHDFGDAVRCLACEAVNSDTAFSMTKFRSFTKGFLSVVKESLTENELNTLYYSPFCMTAELAVRYLTDYLEGDKYFKIGYSRQNLDKAGQRCRLAGDIIPHEEEMRSFIAEISLRSFL